MVTKEKRTKLKKMFGYLLRKLALIIPTFIGVTFLAFVLVRLAPGDPIVLMTGERGISVTRAAELRARLGLDKPLIVQYGAYLSSVLHGDLGTSLRTKTPVLDEFLTLFPATLELSFFAMLFAIFIGIPAGVIAAVKRNSVLDYSIMGGALVGYSMPIFWWGLLLILFFSTQLGWLPTAGRLDLINYDIDPQTGFMLIDTWLSGEGGWPAFVDALKHLILPMIVLGTIPLAVIARMTRSSMLEVLGEDYIRTARAKGLAPFCVIFRHALRNALIPVVTVIALQICVLMTGAVLTETIFSWPGVGKWLLDSIERRDYPAVQGGILLISVLVILVNTGIDLIYALINPKVRSR